MERILITLPERLLEEVNQIAARNNLSRSKVVREALAKYIYERRKEEEEVLMAEGYREMARENEKDAERYIESVNDLGE